MNRALISLITLMVPLIVPLSSPAMTSKVVGVAGNRVVTSREVQINAALEGLLNSRPLSEFKKLEPGSKAFQAELSRVLLEWVVYLEAQTFKVTQVPPNDIQEAERLVNANIAKTGFQSEWAELDVSNQELLGFLDRKLHAKKFISFKSHASLLPVTDAEALKYFQKNRTKFGDLPFAKFRDSIKLLLSQQQAEQRLNDWFAVLQRKYKIRVVALGSDK